MDPNFKDSPRDSAIKTPALLYTVWHSSFNGFMAVQTQLGRFQNDTHLFFAFSFCVIGICDKRPSGNDQLYWIPMRRGNAQDSRSFGALLCFHLGTLSNMQQATRFKVFPNIWTFYSVS
ncbi:hypothetical protein ILYODFUR_024218 [Ilyodon furcidens]|uniref:Uncharacterized protein n=1 Tax=Ilyodon furcidens TaxID=33524 RepID=A0ABV0SNY2_9TELE